MTACTISHERQGEQLVIRLRGDFDRATAWALRNQLEHAPAGDALIDFSLVRDFSDLGVAVLAHGLTSLSRRVTLRGLRQHQERIFRYCGVSVDDGMRASARAADAPPARAAKLG